ncbi:Peptidase A4 family protein [Amycolatopsis xylanica]|uniref:Peptidase A4 family protein n=1 Tax=Amycolatopsis xylanica TaxID=589385 RepID=A0A1H3S8V7_9PSEU|nr:G1 family glutamic endopeptidase [Amycolatopsis xylanica]SDZ34028.1 Peptidase A4 family protein [Amycolatopsis xylanica]
MLTGAAAPASASALCCMFSDDPFAGYSVSKSSDVRQVTGTWTQPAANCAGGRGAVDFEVNIYSYDLHGPNLYAGVGTNADCASGSPVYSAWYEVTGYDSRVRWDGQVAPGDVFRGTMDYQGDKLYRFTLENLTRGWRKESLAAGPRTPQGTQVGVERPFGRFSDFGSVPFTNVLQDGHPIGEYSPYAATAAFGIIDATQVIPGTLTDNKNFSPKFIHA